MPIQPITTITIDDPSKDSYLLDFNTSSTTNVILEVSPNLFNGQNVRILCVQNGAGDAMVTLGTSIVFASGTPPTFQPIPGAEMLIHGVVMNGQLHASPYANEEYVPTVSVPYYLVDTFTGPAGDITAHMTDSYDTWFKTYTNDFTPTVSGTGYMSMPNQQSTTLYGSTPDIPDTYQVVIELVTGDMAYATNGGGDSLDIFLNTPSASASGWIDNSSGYTVSLEVNQINMGDPNSLVYDWHDVWTVLVQANGAAKMVPPLNNPITWAQPTAITAGPHQLRIDVSPTAVVVSFDNVVVYRGISPDTRDHRAGMFGLYWSLYNNFWNVPEVNNPTITFNSIKVIPTSLPPPKECYYVTRHTNLTGFSGISGGYKNDTWISPDGLTTVAAMSTTGQYGASTTVVRWSIDPTTRATVPTNLLPVGAAGVAHDASDDCNIVVGTWAPDLTLNLYHGFVITGTTLTDLGLGTRAWGTNSSGSVVVGQDNDGYGNAFYWTVGTGLVSMGPISGQSTTSTVAKAVSDDGNTIVGYDSTEYNSATRYCWYYKRSAPGYVVIPTPVGTQYNIIVAMSTDGDLIAGHGLKGSNVSILGYGYAWTYRISTATFSIIPYPSGIPTDSNTTMVVVGMSDDGTTIFGNVTYNPNPSTTSGWIRKDAYGTTPIIPTTPIISTMFELYAISPNGEFVVGQEYVPSAADINVRYFMPVIVAHSPWSADRLSPVEYQDQSYFATSITDDGRTAFGWVSDNVGDGPASWYYICNIQP